MVVICIAVVLLSNRTIELPPLTTIIMCCSSTVIKCDEPLLRLKNGILIGNLYDYNAIIIYQCNAGYVINSDTQPASKGLAELRGRCTEEGTWDINFKSISCES